MKTPETICPRCGCGVESGWQYPSCADFATQEERFAAHRKWCTRFAPDVCSGCLTEEDEAYARAEERGEALARKMHADGSLRARSPRREMRLA